jgi:hypothetical protein
MKKVRGKFSRSIWGRQQKREYFRFSIVYGREGTMKKNVTIFTIFVFSLMVACLLQAQDAKIKTENGVQVVYNPKEPVSIPGIPTGIQVKQDLCIGDEEGIEDFIFSQIRSIQVDEEENIYVLDSKEVCVKVFDKNGKHVRTFGKRGQGPGEIQLPSRMYLVAGKEILIYDAGNSRLSYYSPDGKCLREISTGKHFFSRAIPDSKGNIITQLLVPGDTLVYEIKKFDSNLNPLVTIGSIEEERAPYVLNIVTPTLNVRLMTNDNIAWGYPKKYEIFVVSPEGKTLRKIVKDYNPVKITEEEKEGLIKDTFGDQGLPSGFKLEFPKNYYPYYFFICGDDGRIYVRTYEKDKEGNFKYDVFDPEGRYIANFLLPGIDFLYVVKNNKMYSMVWEDEKGIPVVKRYAVTWKF